MESRAKEMRVKLLTLLRRQAIACTPDQWPTRCRACRDQESYIIRVLAGTTKMTVEEAIKGFEKVSTV